MAHAETAPEPQPKSEAPEPRPKSEAEYEPKHDGLANAEPVVDLSQVNDIWHAAFKVHWISFSVCFALLALFNVYRLSNTYRLKRMPNRGYICIVQTLVIVLGLTRTLAFCFSPYGLTINVPNLPQIIPRLLFAVGFPCIITGFTFVHKIFLKISKVQIFTQSRAILKRRCVLVVLITHFLAVLTSEVITGYVHGTEILLIICSFYYFIGCLGVSLSLFFSGRKIMSKTRRVRENLNRDYSVQECGETRKTNTVKKVTQKTGPASKVLKITTTTVIFGFLSSLLYVYSLVWMIRMVSGEKKTPSPWVWLSVNTLLRMCELFLALAMTYSVCYTYRERYVEPEISDIGLRCRKWHTILHSFHFILFYFYFYREDNTWVFENICNLFRMSRISHTSISECSTYTRNIYI